MLFADCYHKIEAYQICENKERTYLYNYFAHNDGTNGKARKKEKRITHSLSNEYMSKYETQEDVERRAKFYTSEQVERYLKKYGIPKTRVATQALIELGYPKADHETIESVGYVHFDVHPQQINIWDKASGKLIVCIGK